MSRSNQTAAAIGSYGHQSMKHCLISGRITLWNQLKTPCTTLQLDYLISEKHHQHISSSLVYASTEDTKKHVAF